MIKTGQAPKKRARLLVLLILGFFTVFVRLIYVQIFQHEHYLSLAQQQSHRTIDLPAQRGRILDRHGRILAESYLSKSLWGDPSFMEVGEELDKTLEVIADILMEPRKDFVTKSRRKNKFVWFKRRLNSSSVEAITPLVERTPGLYFKEEWSRFYATDQMLSPVLGIVGVEHKGLTGLEQRYNRILTGKDGQIKQAHDRKGRVLREYVLQDPVEGQDLQLAIDMSIQTILFQELEKGFVQCRAKVGSAMVMDVHSGEVLALATLPSHQPGQRVQNNLEGLNARMVVDTFEPGSTMKPLIYGAMLQAGLGRPEEMIHCGNGKKRFGHRILNDVHGHGLLSMEDVIVKSSNIGAAEMGIRLGKDRLYQSLDRLGFGHLNHLPFHGEPRGTLRPVHKWSDYSITSIPMGHEISVNMVQMVRAYGAVANGGMVIQPCLERAILSSDGKTLRRREGIRLGRVFSQKTCNAMLRALGLVVTEGTAKRANSALYTIGGKTGTTEKIVDGKYSKDKNIGSFVGVAPLDNPRIVVMVTMDEPEGSSFGGVVAAPVARRVIEDVLRYMQVPPKSPEDT